MARAELADVITDDSGNVLKNTHVVVYEIDGTTALTQTMYDAPTGGSVVTPSATQPKTDSLGLLHLYATSGQRVKLTITGDTGSQKDASFFPDASLTLTQNPGVMATLDAGLTVTRDSGGSATAPAITARDTNAAGYGLRIRNSGDTTNLLLVSATNAALTVPASVVANATAYALTLQNTQSSGNVFNVLSPTGAVIARWGPDGLEMPTQHAMARLAIGQGFAVTTELVKLQHTALPGSGWTNLNSVVEYTNTGNDDSNAKFIASQNTTGDTRLTAINPVVVRQVGSGTMVTMPAEFTLNSTIAPTIDTEYHHGMWIVQNVYGFISTAGPFNPQASAIKISGDSGWHDFIRAYDRDPHGGGTGVTAFRVSGGFRSGDRIGDIVSVGDIYSYAQAGLTGAGNGGTRVGVLNHVNATSTTTWGGMHFDNTQNALVLGARTLGTGYRPILLAPNGGAVAVGQATSAAIPAGTLFQVVGLMAAAATGSSAATPTYSFVGDTNTGMFSSAGDTLQFTTAGTEAFRITSTGLMSFSNPSTQVFAPGGGTTALLGTIGATGPTTQAMSAWLKILTNGTSGFLPIWR